MQSDCQVLTMKRKNAQVSLKTPLAIKKRMYDKGDFERLCTADVKAEQTSDFAYRAPVRRDYARILHSSSFRRLEGKTQLFPGQESDFFRNRLTHSLEVAQIAKDIAHHLNHHNSAIESKIDPDICEIAGLLHDLGHPPFGHNGEKALDDCMKTSGGFEGNAQTLRIILRLEKKERTRENGRYQTFFEGIDKRLGLNLTSRVIASALKYDREIPYKRKKTDKLVKGYFRSEKKEIDEIKRNVIGGAYKGKFKTVECMIMDIADDIAYSTYDIEDAFKAGFLNIYDILSASEEVIAYIKNCLLAEQAGEKEPKTYSSEDIRRVLLQIFGYNLSLIIEKQKDMLDKPNYMEESISCFVDSYESSKNVTNDGYLRTAFTSNLVERFIGKIKYKYDQNFPCLSKVELDEDARLEVSVLKYFSYASLINSSKLKIAEFRGYDIVKSIFHALSDYDREGYRLLPEDYQWQYFNIEESQRERIICDFIAGMTDRYALEFFGRLYSENPETIFKPF